MNKRIDSIDGWRIMAAMGVLFTHSWATLNFPTMMLGPVDLMQVINLWGHGVQFFFVISGFCFFLVLSKKPTYDLATITTFWKKRWLRIAPAFYFVLLVTAVLHRDSFGHDLGYRLLMNVLFLQNLVPDVEVDSIFWSLSVEWHFYLLLPLVFLLIRKAGMARAMAILMCIHIVLNLLHFKGYLAPGDGWAYTIFGNFGYFIWGMSVGYLFSRGIRIGLFTKRISIFLGLGIAYAGKLMFFSSVVSRAPSLAFVLKTVGPLIMTLGFSCMVYSSLENAYLSKVIGNRIFSALGKISYSFYLWHNLTVHFIYDYIHAWLPAGAAAVFILIAVSLVILIPLSYLSYRIFESFYFRLQLA